MSAIARTALAARPNLFVSVCLGVLEKKPVVDSALNDIMQKFFGKTGWTPALTHIVAGALPPGLRLSGTTGRIEKGYRAYGYELALRGLVAHLKRRDA